MQMVDVEDGRVLGAERRVGNDELPHMPLQEGLTAGLAWERTVRRILIHAKKAFIEYH